MKKRIINPTLLLTMLVLTGSAQAQLSVGLSVAANNPLRSTTDSLPGIRGGGSFKLSASEAVGRISMNVTVGRQFLNTGGGFEAMANQYGYTKEKGFTIHSRSAGFTVLAAGAGVNLLSQGTTDCGMPKPALVLGVRGGAYIADSKVDGQVKSGAGTTVFALQQTGKTTTPFYRASLDLLYPVSNKVSLTTGAAWSRASGKMDLLRSSNGSNAVGHFTYTDLQFSVGVQIAFPHTHASGQPQARVQGQPIGGIVVKGGQNPGAGTRPKGNAIVAGQPIGGIVVKGGKDSKPTSLVYADDFPVNDPTLLSYLGTDQLVIEKGEYAFDYSANPEGRVMLHLHSRGIVHRDLAARSFLFERATDGGQTFTYSIEPQYVNGVAKDLLVTYKGSTF
ncbi:MAG TPA: hypothetical protein VGN00_19265 [Puia sp.]|jgi:hypothetical protein